MTTNQKQLEIHILNQKILSKITFLKKDIGGSRYVMLFNFVFLAVLVVPIVILFNSLSSGRLINSFHYWTWADGFDLTDYLIRLFYWLLLSSGL